MTAGNSLFIAGNNLIVEGVSDQIIIANMSQLITRIKGTVIFDLENVAISPAGGAENTVSLAALCASSCDNVAVLLDHDPEGIRAHNRLLKLGTLPESKILFINVANPDYLTIEDLVEDSVYHQAVIKAYEDVFPNSPIIERLSSLTNERREEGSQTTLQRYQSLFSENLDDWGSFDKVLVARKIAQLTLDESETKNWEDTIKAFLDLFSHIDGAFKVPLTR